MIDPNNPTGATYPTPVRRALLEFAEQHGLPILADEVYGDLGYDGPSRRWAVWTGRRHHFVVKPVEGVPRTGLAHRMAAVGTSPRLDDVLAAIRKLADGRLCSTVPMQHAVTAALTGDKPHQSSAAGGAQERAAITADAAGDSGVSCMTPRGLLRDAAGRAAARTHRRRLRARRCCARPASCACMDPDSACPRPTAISESSFSPRRGARDVYRLMAEFTAGFLR